MEIFHASTTAQEARGLTATCFHAIAAGWPIKYAKISAVQGVNGAAPAAQLDLDAMMADAADLAAKLTQSAAARMPVVMKLPPVDAEGKGVL